MRSVPIRCVAACILASCTLGCEMVKRKTVCYEFSSTEEAMRRANRAANKHDATPEDLARAAETFRASAKTLGPAAGVPAVDEYKELILELAESFDRSARGAPENDVTAPTDFTDYMDAHQKILAFHEWCTG